MADKELGLLAHLMRRAGFGATLQELEESRAQGYEATVDALVHPEDASDWDDDLFRRYQPDLNSVMYFESAQNYWMYKMINSKRPLEEKIALFWHGLFATAYGKLNHAKGVVNQTDTFRRHGLGPFHSILMELSRDPAMIFWLDNKDNHKYAPNENYGRELLELFSMGIGNYTEDDVKNCARAFTGWTLANAEYMLRPRIVPGLHLALRARIDWQFEYRPDDHDDTEKRFLGHTGNFNGEDIIDIIATRPATSWFHRRQALQLLRFRHSKRRGHKLPGRGVPQIERRYPLDAARAVPCRTTSSRKTFGTPRSRVRPSWSSAPPGSPAASQLPNGTSPTWPATPTSWARRS